MASRWSSISKLLSLHILLGLSLVSNGITPPAPAATEVRLEQLHGGAQSDPLTIMTQVFISENNEKVTLLLPIQTN